MSRRIFRCVFIGVVVLAGVGACAVLDALGPKEAPRVYMLERARKQPVTQAGVKQRPKIAVSVPQAWPGFGSMEIAYTTTSNRIEYYAQSAWVDSPARMIGSLLVQALEDSGLFSAVVEPSAGLAADLRIDCQIVKIQHEFATDRSVGRVVLRAQWINLASAQVLGTRTFDASVPAPSDDPPGAVAAINQALSNVIDRILDTSREFVGKASARKN